MIRNGNRRFGNVDCPGIEVSGATAKLYLSRLIVNAQWKYTYVAECSIKAPWLLCFLGRAPSPDLVSFCRQQPR